MAPPDVAATAMTPQQLHARLEALAVTAHERSVLGQIEEVLSTLAYDRRVQFWVSPRSNCGRSPPLEALASGEFDQVLLAAAEFASGLTSAELK